MRLSDLRPLYALTACGHFTSCCLSGRSLASNAATVRVTSSACTRWMTAIVAADERRRSASRLCTRLRTSFATAVHTDRRLGRFSTVVSRPLTCRNCTLKSPRDSLWVSGTDGNVLHIFHYEYKIICYDNNLYCSCNQPVNVGNCRSSIINSETKLMVSELYVTPLCDR